MGHIWQQTTMDSMLEPVKGALDHPRLESNCQPGRLRSYGDLTLWSREIGDGPGSYGSSWQTTSLIEKLMQERPVPPVDCGPLLTLTIACVLCAVTFTLFRPRGDPKARKAVPPGPELLDGGGPSYCLSGLHALRNASAGQPLMQAAGWWFLNNLQQIQCSRSSSTVAHASPLCLTQIAAICTGVQPQWKI